MNARETRSGLLWPSLLALAGFVVLIGLGTWQIERKFWKEALISMLSERVTAASAMLPAREQWAQLGPTNDEFRRVRFRAEFIHTEEAFVYTVGSALRMDISGPGYWIFTPARLADGSVVIVNRGYVPQDKLDTHARGEGQVLDSVEIVGAMRWSEGRGWFTPKDDPGHNMWYVRDHIAMVVEKGWGQVAPFYIDQESPAPPGGLPKVGPLTVQLRNEHLQYAITWYGLAIVLAAVFTIWARGRRRIPAAES